MQQSTNFKGHVHKSGKKTSTLLMNALLHKVVEMFVASQEHPQSMEVTQQRQRS